MVTFRVLQFYLNATSCLGFSENRIAFARGAVTWSMVGISRIPGFERVSAIEAGPGESRGPHRIVQLSLDHYGLTTGSNVDTSTGFDWAEGCDPFPAVWQAKGASTAAMSPDRR